MQAGDKAVVLSADARRELRQARALLPLLQCSTAAPWSSTVMASDASPYGLGVCQRDLNVETVRSIGAASEKWRYRAGAAVSARKHALGSDTQLSARQVIDDCEVFISGDMAGFEEVPADDDDDDDDD